MRWLDVTSRRGSYQLPAALQWVRALRRQVAAHTRDRAFTAAQEDTRGLRKKRGGPSAEPYLTPPTRGVPTAAVEVADKKWSEVLRNVCFER